MGQVRFWAVLAAVVAFASPPARGRTTFPERHEIEIPRITPVYCRLDSAQHSRVVNAGFGDVYDAIGRKLGWRGRTMIIGPAKGDGQRMALFEHADEHLQMQAAAFYFEPHEDGLTLVVADFAEPNHPLMSALGEGAVRLRHGSAARCVEGGRAT